MVEASGFDEFFRVEHPKLIAFALAMTGDRESARDAAQEALLRAYRAWPHVEHLDRPGAWVRRVLVNLVIDGQRRRGRERRALGRIRDEPTVPADPESDRFWAAVRTLPERQRAAVALYYVDDLSVADVATVLGIAEGTVKASLAKARANLAATLGLEVQ